MVRFPIIPALQYSNTPMTFRPGIKYPKMIWTILIYV